jgi:site-specific DNA recombinase
MRAIGYFSSQHAAPDDPLLVEQREAFASYCQAHGHQPVETFEEHTVLENGRVQYRRLLEYIGQSGKEFLVIVAGPQILGHDLESSVRRILELGALGSEIRCFDDEMPDPLQQALKYWGKGTGSKVRGERIKAAMMVRAFRGEGLGKPPFGYRIGDDNKLEVVPEETATVQLIFSLYTQKDLGMRLIVRHLNQLGAPTRRGGGWSIVTVRDVLRNRAYLGTYTRFGVRVPRSHQAIIEREEFDLAQQNMAQRRTPRASHPGESFLLSGLAYCSNCGNRMIGVSRRQGWRRKDGSSSIGHYRYYQCQSRTNQGMCSYHTWRSESLERSVLDKLREALEQGIIDLLQAGTAPQQRSDADRNVKRLERQFLKALEAVAAGIISLDRLRPIFEELDAHRSLLEGVPLPQDPGVEALARGDPSLLMQGWDSMGRETQSYLIRALVSRVSVGDDSVDVTLNQGE